MRAFLIITFTLIISAAFSQPGYLGKKNWIQADLNLFSALFNPNATADYQDYVDGGSSIFGRTLNINTTEYIKFHRCLDRKKSFHIGYGYGETGMESIYEYSHHDNNDGYISNTRSYSAPTSTYPSFELMNINYDGQEFDKVPFYTSTHHISAGITFFKNGKIGNIAPLGFYTTVQLDYLITNFTLSKLKAVLATTSSNIA